MLRRLSLCFLCSVLCLLCNVPRILAKGSNPTFAESVAKYAQLQRDLEASLPAQKTTTESEQIGGRQKDLALRISIARLGARQGDIFTHDVAEQFVKIIRKAFKEPGGRVMRKTIEERDLVKHVVLHVNGAYPEDLTRTTMPPTLLNRLPVLPKELAYRIVRRDLVLEDIKANLIVDFIPNAIP